MNKFLRQFALPLLLVTLLSGNQIHATLTPVELKTEFAGNPLGVDISQPRLSWKLTSDSRGDRQTAYEISSAEQRRSLEQRQGKVG
jgi:alpha-L-rhamnosidase